MSDYSKLQQLAEAADRQMPSPWFVHRDGMGSEFPPHPNQNFGVDDARGWAVAWHGVGRNSGIWLEEVAEFMAAANPAAVRALIAENETLRPDAERYRGVRRVANQQGFSDEQFDQQTDTRIANFDASQAKEVTP